MGHLSMLVQADKRQLLDHSATQDVSKREQ